jgi:hypothetical protein
MHNLDETIKSGRHSMECSTECACVFAHVHVCILIWDLPCRFVQPDVGVDMFGLPEIDEEERRAILEASLVSVHNLSILIFAHCLSMRILQ